MYSNVLMYNSLTDRFRSYVLGTIRFFNDHVRITHPCNSGLRNLYRMTSLHVVAICLI